MARGSRGPAHRTVRAVSAHARAQGREGCRRCAGRPHGADGPGTHRPRRQLPGHAGLRTTPPDASGDPRDGEAQREVMVRGGDRTDGTPSANRCAFDRGPLFGTHPPQRTSSGRAADQAAEETPYTWPRPTERQNCTKPLPRGHPYTVRGPWRTARSSGRSATSGRTSSWRARSGTWRFGTPSSTPGGARWPTRAFMPRPAGWWKRPSSRRRRA